MYIKKLRDRLNITSHNLFLKYFLKRLEILQTECKLVIKSAIIGLNIIVLIILTGCWDFQDIERKAVVITVGVEKVENEIHILDEVAGFNVGVSDASGKKAEGINLYHLEGRGKDFETARLHIETQSPFPLFLGATRVVVFGTEFAKQGIEPYLNRIDLLPDFRNTVLTVISREKPKEIIQMQQEKDQATGFLIENIFYQLTEKGSALYTTVGEMLSAIAMDNVGFLIPYIGIRNDDIEYMGLAVMKNSKFIGFIPLQETDGILYLLNNKPRLTELMPYKKHEEKQKNEEENKISYTTHVKKKKIKTSYKGEQVQINISLQLSAELRYQYYSQSIEESDVKKLENQISEKVKMDIADIVKKSQREFECDFFKFARYFKAQNPKVYKEIDWEKAYPKAKVDVEVKTTIINKNFRDPGASKGK